jgi:glutathione peroxidase
MRLTSTARSYSRLVVARVPGHNVYRHRLTLLDGSEFDLGSRRGRPTLIVNTASRCGYARQLHGLQQLHERYAGDGLLVLGCPSADFGGHEYDDPAEIARRCGEAYDVTFPLTEPMHVRFEPDGLWRELATQPGSGAPVWNFNKYLVTGDGRVAGWWSTNVEPNHARIREAVELELIQIRRPSPRTLR